MPVTSSRLPPLTPHTPTHPCRATGTLVEDHVAAAAAAMVAGLPPPPPLSLAASYHESDLWQRFGVVLDGEGELGVAWRVCCW